MEDASQVVNFAKPSIGTQLGILATPTRMTQSTASMVTTGIKRFSCSPPADGLLSGGLPRGHILEVSGPPGTLKESVGLLMAKSFVSESEGVLFVGMKYRCVQPFRNRIIHLFQTHKI